MFEITEENIKNKNFPYDHPLAREIVELDYCEGDPDDYINECEDSASDYACALNCLNNISWEDVEKELTINKYYGTMNLESRGITMEVNLKEMSLTDLEELKKSIDKEKESRKKNKSNELRDKLSALIQEIEDNGMELKIIPNGTFYTLNDVAVDQLEVHEVSFYIE